MLAKATVIGFIPVADLARAEQFFHAKLGLTVLDASNGFALMLQAAGGATVRCVLAPAGTRPQPFTIFGWEVADMHASVRELVAAGVEPIFYPQFEQSADGVWTAPNGDQVAWFQDPDGNVLSLSRHAK